MDTRKALVIEDDKEDGRIVVRALEAIGFSCDLETDGMRGYEKARTGVYSLAVVDNILPGLQGPEIIAQLRCDGNSLPVIVLSELGSEANFIHGLNNGADDYMRKPCSPGELQARVEALFRRMEYVRNPLSLKSLVCGDLVVDPGCRRVKRGRRVISLTPMEYNLLEYLMRNRGRLLTADAIIGQVWGFDAGTSRNLLATRLSQLRQKLALPGETDPIVTRRGFGYGIV